MGAKSFLAWVKNEILLLGSKLKATNDLNIHRIVGKRF